MATYALLFDKIRDIAFKYSLDSTLSGYHYELINILMRNHIDDIYAANSFPAAMNLFNRACTAHLGIALEINQFITDAKDIQLLYEIFSDWRIRLLAESV